MLYPNLVIAKETKGTWQTAHCSLKPDEPLLTFNLDFLEAIFQKTELQRKGNKAPHSTN